MDYSPNIGYEHESTLLAQQSFVMPQYGTFIRSGPVYARPDPTVPHNSITIGNLEQKTYNQIDILIYKNQ